MRESEVECTITIDHDGVIRNGSQTKLGVITFPNGSKGILAKNELIRPWYRSPELKFVESNSGEGEK